MNLEIKINIVCDADCRRINPQVEQFSQAYTLEDALKSYSEAEYRRGLVLGWDSAS